MGRQPSEFPKPRTRRFSVRKVDACLGVGAAIAFALLLQSLVANNRSNFSFQLPTIFGIDIWSIKFLDVSASAALMSAFISLFLLRSHFVFASIPVFDYRISRSTGAISINEDSKGDQEIYAIELRNATKAVGIVTAAKYWIEFKTEEIRGPTRGNFMGWFQRRPAYHSKSRYTLSYHDLEATLKASGFMDGRDWDAVHFGDWSAFGADESRRIFVLSVALAHRLVSLDLLLDYETVLGDRFRREIYMVPRRQFMDSTYEDEAGPGNMEIHSVRAAPLPASGLPNSSEQQAWAK